MPIYEYKCKACGHRLEKLQRLTADPLRDCPACHRSELTRLVSAAGFRLAGSGWYETDFKTGSKQNLASDSGSGNASNDSQGSTSSAESSKNGATA